MSTAVLLSALVDDAGLFPPEELAMGAAVRRHRADSRGGSRVLSGRFVCPVARLDELGRELVDDERIDVSLIVPSFDDETVAASIACAAAHPRVSVANLEGPLPSGAALARKIDVLPSFVELPVISGWHDGLTAVAAEGLGVKIRCGGVRAELFPSPEQLGGLVHACVEGGVPFKATAGLHHAVRGRDEATGFVHHGFLNLLVATCRAEAGHGLDSTVGALATEDPSELVSEALEVPDALAHSARRAFRSYGSCSTSEPVEDLRALGLVP